MNKKLVLLGSAAIFSFSVLVAFRGAKTLAEQTMEIQSSITSKLETLRTEKTAECDARVITEAQSRFAAANPAPAESKPVAPSIAAPVKKGGKKGQTTTTTSPKVDPLPQPVPPTKPTDPSKARGGAVQEGNAEDAKKRGGAVQNAADGSVKPADVKKRGSATKTEGGGN